MRRDNNNQEEKIPEEFLCPITQEIMVDPVSTEVGHTYERKAIEKWLSQHDTDPLRNQILTSKKLTPNWALKSLIANWLKGHPQCTSEEFLEAVRNKSIKEVEQLIFLGANINTKDQAGSTPLHWAAYNENKPLVELLLKNGAKLEIIDNNGETPLLENIKFVGKYEIVKFLLEKGANLKCRYTDGTTPLHKAAATHQLDKIKLLLQFGTDVNVTTKANKEKEAKEVRKNDGQTPLHIAVALGNITVTTFLLMKGANITTKDHRGNTALIIAIGTGNVDMAKLLINKRADLEAVDNKFNGTALHWAALRNNFSITKYLLDHNANVMAKSKFDWTPLHWAAKEGSSNVIQLLLEEGADPKANDSNGKTPSQLASENGHKEVANLIIEISKSIKRTLPRNLKTAQQIIQKMQQQIEQQQQQIYVLTQQLEEVTQKTLSKPFSQAKLIMKQTAIYQSSTSSQQDSQLTKKFIKAAQDGDIESLQESLQQGIDVNVTDGGEYQATALHWAASSENVEVVKFLLGAGADPRIPDTSGETPLAWAERAENDNVVALFHERNNIPGGYLQ